MKQIMLFLCLIIACLLMSGAVGAACVIENPRVTVRVDQGRINYITHQSRAQFAPDNDRVRGLTSASFTIRYDGTPRIKNENKRACVGIKEVIFYIGVPVFNVYIDRKYKPGTCEYKVIKDHENYHVEVYRQGVKFFQSDIERELKKALNKQKPRYVHSQKEAERVLNEQFKQILKDVQPLVDHINKKLKEKNEAIDTPESYKATQDLCDNW